MTTHTEVLKLIDEIENDDENLELLERAMHYFCGTHDICSGYKHALESCIDDQYTNHPEEQEDGDMDKLKAILLGK